MSAAFNGARMSDYEFMMSLRVRHPRIDPPEVTREVTQGHAAPLLVEVHQHLDSTTLRAVVLGNTMPTSVLSGVSWTAEAARAASDGR
jgi:hypothetical protein